MTGGRIAIIALLALTLTGCSPTPGANPSAAEAGGWDPGIAGIEEPGSAVESDAAAQVDAIESALTSAGFTTNGVIVVDETTNPVVFVGYSGNGCLIGKLGFWMNEDTYIFRIPELDPEQFADPASAVASLSC